MKVFQLSSFVKNASTKFDCSGSRKIHYLQHLLGTSSLNKLANCEWHTIQNCPEIARAPRLTRNAAEQTFDMEQTHLPKSLKRHSTGASKAPLPNELIIQVLGYLEKHELKIARLVCKTWSHFASEPLFDKLYISPREEDIRVFKLVTQHPQLRHCYNAGIRCYSLLTRHDDFDIYSRAGRFH